MKIKLNVLNANNKFSKWDVRTSINSIDLFGHSKEIYIEHGSEEYTLIINDQDELELILGCNKLH